uniref:Uncharacterized protein n=1 Tax=Nelumbo nucifera TaxID=4432 RepID=A0A822Z3N1_NELNU|nr:TPA_asm: hypothetical protein HUJ06_013730 [Nelumbo nucifera]
MRKLPFSSYTHLCFSGKPKFLQLQLHSPKQGIWFVLKREENGAKEMGLPFSHCMKEILGILGLIYFTLKCELLFI